ncbi:sulfur carrier protein ThiS [Plantactinospora siamensis]|uniref:Sulfur carrier protein ThiS n=1 Tax=Plantactinospora siamensis TaxID=555372 RepID=A0ABV6P468_9ACTN
MTVTLNGTATDMADGATVGDLVRRYAPDRRRIAVARNGEVVPRGDWDGTALVEADVVEVLTPVAGG